MRPADKLQFEAFKSCALLCVSKSYAAVRTVSDSLSHITLLPAKLWADLMPDSDSSSESQRPA